MDAKLKYDEQLTAYNQQMAQIEAVSKQQSQAEEAAKQAYLQQEMANLQKVIPEFADKSKATQIRDSWCLMVQSCTGMRRMRYPK